MIFVSCKFQGLYVYHCSNGKTKEHAAGCDVCLSCVQSMQSQNDEPLEFQSRCQQSLYDTIKQFVRETTR